MSAWYAVNAGAAFGSIMPVYVLQIVGLSAVILPTATPSAAAWRAGALPFALICSFLIDIPWLWRRGGEWPVHAEQGPDRGARRPDG